MFNLPHRPPAKPPHHSRQIELKELHVDWVLFKFCPKSYGNGSYFLQLLHYNCYCVQSILKNATSCGFHVLKIRKGVSYWLGYICVKLLEKGKYYSICWKIYKVFESLVLVDEIGKEADRVVFMIRKVGSHDDRGNSLQNYVPYVAVHVRVEIDWMIHCKNLEQKLNTNQICSSRKDQWKYWAVEVRGHLKVHSILVENLSNKGQMLIEMLCEESISIFLK
jgi:hypothetical protein